MISPRRKKSVGVALEKFTRYIWYYHYVSSNKLIVSITTKLSSTVVHEQGVLNGEEIAVKKLFWESALDDKAFENEFNNLMKVKHKNVIRLIGYCYEIAHKHIIEHNGKLVFGQVIDRALCFEYMQGGSLLKHISGTIGALPPRF